MKIPSRFRKIARRVTGSSAAEPMAPEALRDLAAREPVVVLRIGGGAADGRLPGEQRSTSLGSLLETVRDVPVGRPIVTHCG
jgi:hypothetical protein